MIRTMPLVTLTLRGLVDRRRFWVMVLLSAVPVLIAKFMSGEISNNTGGLVLWPVWALIPIGFSLLALQGLSELIKRVAILRGDAPDAIALADAEANTL